MIKLCALPKMVSAAQQAFLTLKEDMASINVSHNAAAALRVFSNSCECIIPHSGIWHQSLLECVVPYASCLYIG